MGARLESLDDSPYSQLFDFNPHLNRVVHQHLTCADFACLPESRLGYFTASFVRNPYDRVYSGFRQFRKDILEQPQPGFSEPWIRELVVKQLAGVSAQLHAASFQFDEWLGLVTDDQVYEAGRNTSFPLHPAHYWTHIAGRQAVDFIGRVENFETDFQLFLDRAGIGPLPVVNANVVELEAAAANPHGYRYIDRMQARSIAKINRLFARDFELFGYAQLAAEENGSARDPGNDDKAITSVAAGG